MDNFSDIPEKSEKWQQISDSIKATKLRRENSRPIVRILKIQSNKLSKSDNYHLEGLFIEAKRLHNHLLSLGNNHHKVEKRLIKENQEYIKTYLDYWSFKSKKLKIRNSHKKPEVRDIKFLSSHMKQSLWERIQDSISWLSESKKKWRKIGRLKFKSEVHSIPLKQYQNTYKVFLDEEKISIQWLKKKLKVHWMDQIKKFWPDLDFASAQLVRKADWYYLHVLLYIPKEDISHREYLPSLGIDTWVKDQLTLSQGNCKIQFDHINSQDSKVYKKLQKSISRARVTKTQPWAKSKYRKRTKKELMESRATGRNYQKRCLRLKKMKLQDERRKNDRENKLVHALKQSFGVVYLEDINYSWWQAMWGKQTTSNRVATVVKKIDMTWISKKIDRFQKTSLVCRYSGFSPPELGLLKRLERLKIRSWHCECCNEEKDRDFEAAKVIESEGRKLHNDTRKDGSIQKFLETIQTISNIKIQLT